MVVLMNLMNVINMTWADFSIKLSAAGCMKDD